MDKLNKILTFILGLLTLSDVFLKNVKSNLDFITKPLFSINILEIGIIIVMLIFFYRMVFPKFNRILLQVRSEKFWKNWKKFKVILCEYHEIEDPSLQSDYEKIREKLEIDFNFFVPSIKLIQQASHRDNNEIIIGNFEKCILIRNLSQWEAKTKRRLPEEVDCFDYLLIALKEDWKKPERPRK